MTGELSTLAELPEQLSAIGASIAAGAAAIERASIALSDDRAVLRRAGVRLRLCFSHQDTRTVLCFFKSAGSVYAPVDATVDFAAVPDSNGLERVAVTEAMPRRIGLPTFFAAGLSDDEVTRFGPPGATRENTVFLALGADLLAIKDPDRPSRASLRYSPGRVPGAVEAKKFRLAPLVQLLATVRDWVRCDMPVRVAAQAVNAGEASAARGILDSLIRGYAGTCEALGTYRLRDFTAAVRMRLDAQGRVAVRPGDEAFQLAFRLKVGESGADIAVGPPDMAADGPLLAAFLDELACGPRAKRALARLLGCFEVQVPAFLDSARAGAIAVRAGREGSSDRELLWLPGTVANSPRNLLLSAVFHVDLRAEPRVSLDDTYDLEAVADPADASSVAYFLRLVANIRTWVNLLA